MTTLSFNCDLKTKLSQLYSNDEADDKETYEWKILGQEQDESILISWKVNSSKSLSEIKTYIGVYHSGLNNLKVLNVSNSSDNVIQASVNANKTLLLYVTKEVNTGFNNEWKYKLHFTSTVNSYSVCKEIDIESHHQLMAQFLYRRKPSTEVDKFLVFILRDCITLYQLSFIPSGVDLTSEIKNVKYEIVETVVKAFSWAQWDATHQSLFYIHYRKPTVREEGEGSEVANIVQSPTLSALQFNDSTPHETVLNIPLNLPPPVLESSCNTYDDVPIPLRVHDCALDVTVLSDGRGVVCICHHYLYQPVSAPKANQEMTESTTVHLAYSVTLLHHGLVIHCTLPGIPWFQASEVKPTFALHKDDYLIVYMPGLFVHLLDFGPGHEPCCHIVLNHEVSNSEQWASLKQSGKGIGLVNLRTLKVFNLDICPKLLLETYFDQKLGLSNKLSIIHYFLVHRYDFDIISELLQSISEDCLNNSAQEIFHEILVGGAYASVYKSLPSDGIKLMRFLPLTTVNQFATMEVKLDGRIMTLTQEALWNPAVMLLSPRQRLCQFRTDLWTKLWDLIADTSCISRFKPTTIAEKLMVSLICYQPEALSRCSTPLSPGSGLCVNTTLAEMTSAGNYRIKPILPFYEVEKCTASKQEHVISVNLRELSIHLVKHGLENPLQVHVVATRYAAAQLEMSRFLCSLITNAVGVSIQQVKGFQLVNDLPPLKKKVLFFVLERYSLAVDFLAYPIPQGFSSFFTYLAYRSMTFDKFLQYVQANALQLQIDVMKMIFPELGDSKEGVKKKLRLLLLLPRSRARRLLNQWTHPLSLMLRAREHAVNILSGVEARTHRHKTNLNVIGQTTFHSSDRYSPLDTFLDLLTAKASLAELDFNLLVEATMSSVEDY